MEFEAHGLEETSEHTEPNSGELAFDVSGSIEDGNATGYEALFETDDDIPLPDFTGVWADENALGSMWSEDDEAQNGSVPHPVEQGGRSWGISVGRDELDSLRPVDEEPAVVEEEARVARKLQLVMVVLFGLIALAVIFLDDPAVVDDLREFYDGIFG